MEKQKEEKQANYPPYPPPYYIPCDNDEIDLYELFLTLKKRWKVVIASVLFFLIGAFLYLVITPEKYKSQGVISLSYQITGNGAKIFYIPPDVIEGLVNNYFQLLKAAKAGYTIPEKKFFPNEIVDKTISIEIVKRRNDKGVLLVPITATSPDIVVKDFQYLVAFLEEKLRPIKEQIIRTKKLQLKFLIEQKNKLLKFLAQSEKSPEVKGYLINKIQDLEQKINSLKIELQTFSVFKTFPPAKPVEPYAPKKWVVILVSLFSGLFIGIFLAFFLEWWQSVSQKHKQEETS